MAEKMSNAEYRAKEGISASDLKTMTSSMAKWKYKKDNPETKKSPALLEGSAIHKMFLEPSDFNNEYIVIKDFNCSNKEGKAAYIEYVEKEIGRSLTDEEKKYKDSITNTLMSCGKEVITEELYDKICKMRDAAFSVPYVKKLLYGQHEESFFWQDEKFDIPCKCRPDSYGKIGDTHICVDLKSCTNAETSEFMRQAIKLNYDVQAAHYCEGLKACTGDDYKFVFIAVEKEEPFLVNILEADEDFMQSGSEVRDIMLQQYKECLERDEWTGYMGFNDETKINSLGVPNWLKKAYDSESEVE